MFCSVKDSCSNRCQISKCSLCYYARVRVKEPARPRCKPCDKTSYRQCWYKYYQCRYKYYGTYGHYVSNRVQFSSIICTISFTEAILLSKLLLLQKSVQVHYTIWMPLKAIARTPNLVENTNIILHIISQSNKM